MKRLFLGLLGLFCCVWVFSQVPSLSLRDINGKTVNIHDFCHQGHPTIISFFATWCKPCLRELKAIAEVYDDWQEETGVKLIAVSIDRAQDVEKVKPLVDGNDWEYTVLLDTEEALKRQFQIQSVPHMLIVDADGKIREQRSGYTDGEEKEVFELLKRISK